MAAAQKGADLTDGTAVLLFCRAETPGNRTLSVSKDTVTDPISTECSERPERRDRRGERWREEEKGGEKRERRGESEVSRVRERERERAWMEEEGQKASFVSSPSAAALSSLFNTLFHFQESRIEEISPSNLIFAFI